MKVKCENTDLARLGRLVASKFESRARERDLHFQVEVFGSLSARLDAAKIERVLLNLLSNAFKFAPAGGNVRFAIHRENDRGVIEVQDSGPGIPPHLREAIFDRFRQGDAGVNRHFGGTGLGLAIAKEFVTLHGGTIKVVGPPQGIGSIFRVELPLLSTAGTVAEVQEELDAEPVAAVVEEFATRDAGGTPAGTMSTKSAPLVMVVEDNPDMNAFVSETLSANYRTVAAFEGQEGLEKALELRPDLILCDVILPGMSGDQLVREIRRHHELEEIPIVLLTARADDALLLQLLKQGAQDYLQKPFAGEQLLGKVERLIANRRRVGQELDRLRELSGRLLQAEHQERREIAHELHENVAQYLAALQMKLEQARKVAVSPEVHRLLDEGNSLLELCCSEIRTMAYALHPAVLEIFGLKAAIDSHVRSFMQRSGIQMNVEVPPTLDRLSAEIELAVFRILQQSLKQIHESGKKKASVRVLHNAEEIGLEVTAEEPHESAEIRMREQALTEMRERVRILGGRLDVCSAQNGITLRAILPLVPRRSEHGGRA